MWKEFKFHRFDKTIGELRVRLATKDDAKLISDYFRKNKIYLKPWEPARDEVFFTEAGWKKKLIKLNELHLLELGFYCLIINKITGEMLGTISFSNLMRFPLHSCSVGYSLDEDMQGKGIMRQALTLACSWMFEIQNMHKIIASYMPDNVKSAAVLEAKGFKKIGVVKDYLLIDGKWQDHILTVLTNTEWQSKQ